MPDPVELVPTPDDNKYITFNREEFWQVVFGWTGYTEDPQSVNSKWHADVEQVEIKDAVVIRRQDRIAPPALGVYASVVGMQASLSDDPKVRRQLLAIADYFQRQSELAGDEAWKFPDL